MLHKSLIGLCLTLCVAACASQPQTTATPKTAQTAKQPPAGCVGAGTATRLPARSGECTGFGNAYSQDQLKSSGYTEANQALSTLDPSVTTNATH